MKLQTGKTYRIEFGFLPNEVQPWIRGEFTATVTESLHPEVGDWPVFTFDNGVRLEGHAFTAQPVE